MEQKVYSFESVWTALQESNRILTEKQAETDRLIKETDRIVKENAERQKDTDRLIKDLAKQVGGVSNSNGDFAEEYFFNTFEQGNKMLCGEEFIDVWGKTPGRERGFQDEYDIVLINGKSLCIVEVKYKADSADFQKLTRKPVTFRENYPKYQNHIVYLALAGMSFHPKTEQSCEENGIAIIKQVGEKVIIKDKHLKAF
jgi:hypothetical protein